MCVGAGLAFAALIFGSALAAVPLSRLMSRRGRRPGLVRGYLTAMTGAGAAVVAAEIESFPLLLAGRVLLGSGTAANLLARYAGADLAAPEHRARAISTVVWATTIGAVAGPNVLGPAGWLADWLGLPSLAGPLLVAFVWFAVAAAVIGLLLRPDPLVVAGGLEAAGAPASRRSALGGAPPSAAPPRREVRARCHGDGQRRHGGGDDDDAAAPARPRRLARDGWSGDVRPRGRHVWGSRRSSVLWPTAAARSRLLTPAPP